MGWDQEVRLGFVRLVRAARMSEGGGSGSGLGFEGGRLGPRRRRQGRKIFVVDQAFAEPPGHFGSVAPAADGAIGPFAIAIPVSFRPR